LELAELSDQFVTATAQVHDLEQDLLNAKRQKLNTQARLEYLQDMRRREFAAKVPRGRGGGMPGRRRMGEKYPWKTRYRGYW
jgi:hypothetical protein